MLAATLKQIFSYNNSDRDIDIKGIQNIENILYSNENQNVSQIVKDIVVHIPKPVRDFFENKLLVPADANPISWFPNMEKYSLHFFKSKQNTTLLMGDSVIRGISHHDSDQRGLDDYLQAVCPKENILTVCHGGYNSIIFQRFLSLLAKAKAKPRLIIIPINLRSFSPIWYLHPLYGFKIEQDIMDNFAKTGNILLPLVKALSVKIQTKIDSLKYLFSEISTEFSENAKVVQYIKIKNYFSPKTAKEIVLRLSSLFSYHYMCHINEDSVIWSSFMKMIETIQDIGVPCIIYNTPINYQAGLQVIGNKFINQVNRNRSQA